MSEKIRVPNLIRKQRRGEKIVMLTAYDYTFARLVDAAGVDVILVGDSLASIVQGHETTLPVTLDEMIYHTKAVRRGVCRALLVADLPFLSYEPSPGDAIRSAGRLLKEGGAEAVKLEGGVRAAETVRALVSAGIPVMGHAGLTPQAVHRFGGHRVQGRSKEQAVEIMNDALALEEAGVFSVVLEGIPGELAGEITDRLGIPTIGIGAGEHCSGQVLVLHDMLGLTVFEDGKKPKFVKEFSKLGGDVRAAVENFSDEVRSGVFPGTEHTYAGRAEKVLELRRGALKGS